MTKLIKYDEHLQKKPQNTTYWRNVFPFQLSIFPTSEFPNVCLYIAKFLFCLFFLWHKLLSVKFLSCCLVRSQLSGGVESINHVCVNAVDNLSESCWQYMGSALQIQRTHHRRRSEENKERRKRGAFLKKECCTKHNEYTWVNMHCNCNYLSSWSISLLQLK